jgi:hypothetical protein
MDFEEILDKPETSEERDYVAEFFDSNPAAEAAANAVGVTDNMLEADFNNAEPKVRDILIKNGIEENIDFVIDSIKKTYISTYEDSLDNADDYSDLDNMLTSELSDSFIFFFPGKTEDEVANVVYEVKDALVNNDYVDLSNLTDEDDDLVAKASENAQDILSGKADTDDVPTDESVDDTDINDDDDVDPTFWD